MSACGTARRSRTAAIRQSSDCLANLTGKRIILKLSAFWHKSAALALLCAAFCALPSYAATEAKSRANGLAEAERRFPFEVVLQEETCERKCYSGYGKKYQTGYAITPEAEFEVVAADPNAEASALKIDIDMIYQNDSGQGSKVEKITTYDYGDLSASDGSTYSFLPDRSIENLAERDRLYSNPQRSLRMTLTYAPEGEDKKTEKQYYQVYSEEELAYYMENAGEEETPEETAAVYYGG